MFEIKFKGKHAPTRNMGYNCTAPGMAGAQTEKNNHNIGSKMCWENTKKQLIQRTTDVKIKLD